MSLAIAASSAATDFSRPTNKGTMRCGKTTMSRSGRTGRVRVVMTIIWESAPLNATAARQCRQPNAIVSAGQRDSAAHGWRAATPIAGHHAALAPHQVERREDQERPPDHQPPRRRLERMGDAPQQPRWPGPRRSATRSARSTLSTAAMISVSTSGANTTSSSEARPARASGIRAWRGPARRASRSADSSRLPDSVSATPTRIASHARRGSRTAAGRKRSGPPSNRRDRRASSA